MQLVAIREPLMDTTPIMARDSKSDVRLAVWVAIGGSHLWRAAVGYEANWRDSSMRVFRKPSTCSEDRRCRCGGVPPPRIHIPTK